MAGENLPLVGKLPGHRRHRTTAGYAHLADGHLVDAAEKVGSTIAEAMQFDKSWQTLIANPLNKGNDTHAIRRCRQTKTTTVPGSAKPRYSIFGRTRQAPAFDGRTAAGGDRLSIATGNFPPFLRSRNSCLRKGFRSIIVAALSCAGGVVMGAVWFRGLLHASSLIKHASSLIKIGSPGRPFPASA